jgi:hypothetical protein
LFVFPEKFEKLKKFSNILPEVLKFTKGEILDLLSCIPEIAKMQESKVINNISLIRKYFNHEILKEYPILLARVQNADKVNFYLNLYFDLSKEDFNELVKRFPILLSADVIILNSARKC